MKGLVATLVLFAALAAPALAQPPTLVVAGTLWRADGATVSDVPLTVDPAVRDADGVRSLALTVDGAPVAGAAPWRIDPAAYGDGTHRFVLTATDNAGEVATEQADVRFSHTRAPRALRAGDPPVLSGRPGEQAGTSVANVGDVDGDGTEDVLVGAPGAGRAGAAYLVRGGGAGRSLTLDPRDPRVLRFAGERRGDAAGTAVAAGGDIDGDGYRDLLIGGRGVVQAVLGGPRPRVARTIRHRDRSFGTVLATRRLGDFAVDGDVDGDGRDDIAIGAPDAAGGRGRVYVGSRVRFTGERPGDHAGAALAFAGDVDHDGRADLLSVEPGANAASLLYASGTRSRVLGGAFSSAGSIGDVDGDSTPDLLLGGERSVVVFAQPGADVDVSHPFPGFTVETPGATRVTGAGDLDGDYAPDVVTNTPAVAYSPLDAPAATPVPVSGPAGGGVDGLDALGDGEPAVLVGGANQVTIVPATAGCQPNRLWTFPYSADHVLPRCRRAHRVVDSPAFNPSPDAGQLAHFNPEPACGAPSRTCQPTAYRSGNARIHGPDVGLTTEEIVDLVDSYGTPLAAIQRAGDGCFTVFDRAHTRVGATCDPTGTPPASHPTDIWVQGRACMATPQLEGTHYLIRLLDPEGDPAAAYRELQGFVRRDQVTLGSALTTVGGATYDPAQLAEAAYTGCGPKPPKRAPVPFPAPSLPGLPTGERLFGFQDRYVSNASFENCEGEFPPDLNPACYGPYANYQVPTLASKDPQLPTGDPRAGADWAALTVSTTGASGAGYPSHPQDGQELEAAGGGFVRAIVPRDRPFSALDGFAYSDPNVPCDTPRVARWLYGAARPRSGERAIYGWTAFRDPQGIRERNGLSPGCP